MQKGFNLIVEDLKKEIAKVTNATGLPITVIEMVLREMSENASSVAKQVIDKEQKEYYANVEKETSGITGTVLEVTE